MEIFIIFLCISQIFLYLIWLWLYSEFQELKNVVAVIDHDYDELINKL